MSNHKDTPVYAELAGVAAYFAVFFVGLHYVDHRLDFLGSLGLIWLSNRAQGAVEWLGRFEVSTRPDPLGPIPVPAALTRAQRLADFPKQLEQLKKLGITITDLRKQGDSRSIRYSFQLMAPEAPSEWWWETEGQYLTLETALARLIELQRQSPYAP